MSELKKLSPEDEISLADFLKSIKGYIRALSQYWRFLLFAWLLSAVSLWFWSESKAPTYEAQLTLMLSDDGGQSITGISSILGQFGLPVSSGKYNIDKLLEIARSRHILEQVLLESCIVNNQNNSIGHHLIQAYQLEDRWTDDLGMDYSTSFSPSMDDKTYQYIVKKLHQLVNGNEPNSGLLKLEYGRDHYIMTFSFESVSEDLSIAYVQKHFEKLKEFYIDRAIEKQQQSYNIIKTKRDSIYNNLVSVEQQLARLKDSSQNSFRSTSGVEQSRLSTQALILKNAYAKAEENLTIAELTLQNNTPLIQLIDPPIGPILPNQFGLFKIAIVSMILGFLMTIVVIITLYIIRL